MGKSVKQIWDGIDVKKLILFLYTIIVSLVMYIRSADMQKMDDNHNRTIEAIKDLRAQVKDNKEKSLAKIEKIDDRLRETEIQLAKAGKGKK